MQQYSIYRDSELVDLLTSGDELAYTEIYQRYWAVLYDHSRRMLRDDDEAMDIVQDIFTMLWKKAGEIDFTSSVKAYLYSAVRNQTLNYINRGKLKLAYLESLSDFLEKGSTVTDDQVIFAELERQIEREVNNLPKKMRDIFMMSRYDGLSHREIAEKLEISEHGIKKSINRAIKIIKLKIHLFILVIL